MLQKMPYTRTAPEEFIDRIYDTWEKPPPDVDYGDIVIDISRRGIFQFVKFGDAVEPLDVTQVERSTVLDAAVPAATERAERRITIDAASVTKDQFASGTMFIDNGRRYIIASNTASDTNDKITLTLREPLQEKVETTHGVRLLSSPYHNWQKGTAYANGSNWLDGGVSPRSHVENMSGFCQIGGECTVQLSADISAAANLGSPVYRGGDGKVTLATQTTTVPPLGRLLIGGAIDVSSRDKIPIVLENLRGMF